MRFYEVPLNSVFKITSTQEQYKKIKEERITCCKIKHNALKLSSNENVVIRPMEEVELVK